jgi:hypothetical protein
VGEALGEGLRAVLGAYGGEGAATPGQLDGAELEGAGVHFGCEIRRAAAEALRAPGETAALAPLRAALRPR